LIQNGQLSRKTAVALVRKYDHEFPHTHHKDHLDYLGMAAEEFTETVDKHRDPGIWDKTEKGEWKHKHPIF
jgi:dihydrodipicolinate reductase